MAALIAASHVVCLPSHREGLPVTLLEAAACGRPVVTTDVPGCREAVEPGGSGLLVPPGDAGALAGSLRSLLHDAALRERMGRRGRELAVERFSARTVNARTLAVYRELTGAAF